MKKLVLLLLLSFVIRHGMAQPLNYGSCQSVTADSPCFFGFFTYFYITKVSVGTLNFTYGDCSGDGSDDGYQDKYSTDSGTVMQDSTYIFSVSRVGSTNGGWFSAWVDWNNDTDFTDTGELLFSVTGAMGPTTQTFSVTVPHDATVGGHRLRVRSDQNDSNGNPNACTHNGSYCDTKDFKLIVAGSTGTPCSVTIHTPYDNGANSCLYGCAATLWAEPSGVAPFTYSWSSVFSTDSFITNSCAGMHILLMSDHNGCYASDTVILNQPDSMYVTAFVDPIHFHCDTLKPGCINITGIWGGAGGPYSYMWSNGQTTSGICTTVAGKYCFAVTDINGCTIDTCFIIPVPPPPAIFNLTLVGQDPSCNGCANGMITATPSGGMPPYTYQWYPNVSTDSIATGLAAGSYTVCVTDDNGCQVCDSATLVNPLALSEQGRGSSFSISPNPAGNKFRVYGLRFITARMEIYNVFGQVCRQTEIVNLKSEIDILSLSPGIYFIRLSGEKESLIGRVVKE